MNTASIPTRNGANGDRLPKRKRRISRDRKTGGKLQLRTLDCLDHRTLAFKNAHSLSAAIEQDLGGAAQLSEGEHQLIQHAAFLSAVIESSKTDWWEAKPVDLIDVFAAINSQRRIFTTLGLRRRARDVTPTPTLDQIAAELEAEDAAIIEQDGGVE
jgi:hypothetical protein